MRVKILILINFAMLYISEEACSVVVTSEFNLQWVVSLLNYIRTCILKWRVLYSHFYYTIGDLSYGSVP